METLLLLSYPDNHYSSYTLDPDASHWLVKGHQAGLVVGSTTIIAPTQVAAINLGETAFRGIYPARSVKVTAERAHG